MRSNILFCALALAGCGVDTTPMFSDGGGWDTDVYTEDASLGYDGSTNQVDPHKRDTGTRPDDSGQVFVPDAGVDADVVVDSGADADVVADSGEDAAVDSGAPYRGQCAPCTSDDQCDNGACSGQFGQPGICRVVGCTAVDPWCNADNGLRCAASSRCFVNTNFFPGGCEEWLPWWLGQQ